ncbi:hypothetical protein HMPREF0083_00281 [Aneurinibacillus aneurinilyticus ATCC 12856]|uniref:Uncharacterized protein n=1 Tax=Aneurinibacillus aneurinilyticus ATCC 12856 TaxID=649747 RepID=U1YHM9_ANEAE|nr:hypothetical protein HMPREF0083_00281 [Aneurinibacillus aneurinilyticus ATCC 12856]
MTYRKNIKQSFLKSLEKKVSLELVEDLDQYRFYVPQDAY